MLTVKQVKEWLNQFPDDMMVHGDYYEASNNIDLRIEDTECTNTISLE